MEDYNHKAIEKRWQNQWDQENVLETKDDSTDTYYCLEMFPYPSGSMHMGHVRNYAIGDCVSRYKRLQGNNVLHPMGWDAFGLPAENAAIDRGVNPREWTENNINTLKEQMSLLGFDYDWDREVKTCDSDYYQWDQWIFTKLFQEGLAYQEESTVNWCSGCQTVLANEQVENNQCWRCDTRVEQKTMNQWNFGITEYADQLIDDLDKLGGWPNKVKKMQRDWIGRSHGAEITFLVSEGNKELTVFTTRPETIYGATYLAVAPEHPFAQKVARDNDRVRRYVEQAVNRSDEARKERPKTGVFTKTHAEHPLTGDEIPIYVAEYVLSDYGTGAIMSVPAHDERDHAFATEHNLPIEQVIQPSTPVDGAYEGDGTLVNSDFLNGSSTDEAKQKVIERLEDNEAGSAKTRYTLEDWLISRQRYWGTPIPIVHCESCGAVPVPEEDLPVELPEDVSFDETGNPIETSTSFTTTNCPSCGQTARRETDTMDTFINSSWYFLRFCSPHQQDSLVDPDDESRFMPVDKYIGGVEHAVMHLLYARFITKFLRDQGLASVDEPFSDLLTQGMVHLNGEKMSKSKNHIVSPEKTVEEYGADAARTFMLFLGKPEKGVDWSDEGIQGIHRFLKQTHALPRTDRVEPRIPYTEKVFNSKWNKLLEQVTEAMEETRLNEAVKLLMEWRDLLNKYDKDSEAWKKSFSAYLRCLNPFAPHITEELWHDHIEDTYCSTAQWPEANEKDIQPSLEYQHDVAVSTLKDLEEIQELTGITEPTSIDIALAPPWKYKLATKVRAIIEDGSVKDAVSKIMQTDLRQHGDKAVSLVQTYIEDQKKLPSVDASRDDDEEAASLFKEAVDTTVTIRNPDGADTKALPGRPELRLHDDE